MKDANVITLSFSQNLTALLGARKAGDPLPQRLQIFKWGENESNQGKFIVNDTTVRLLAANQRQIGRERIPMGFEHNIDEGSDEYKRTKEPRPIAAKMAMEAISGEGVFLSAIDWTPEGSDNIQHYEDLSPTPIIDKATRTVIALLSVSLTRAGSVYGLTLDNAAACRLSASLNPNPHPEPEMNPTLSIVKLAAAFNLPAESTEDQVVAAMARLNAPATITLKIDGKDQTLDMAQLATRVIAIESDRASERAQSSTAERGTLISRLSADGKAPLNPDTMKPYSAEELGKMEPSTLRMLIANTPQNVPMQQRSRLSAGGADVAAVDPNLKGINRVIAANERDMALSKRN